MKFIAIVRFKAGVICLNFAVECGEGRREKVCGKRDENEGESCGTLVG
jgi:hypothetical protein